MSAGQIIDHDGRVILDRDFAIFKIVAQVIWLVLAPDTVTHSIFGSLTSFGFLLICPLVLPILPSLLRPHCHFLSCIIIWVIFVVLDCLHCFIEVF
jgi:hypothetical protein